MYNQFYNGLHGEVETEEKIESRLVIIPENLDQTDFIPNLSILRTSTIGQAITHIRAGSNLLGINNFDFESISRFVVE
jgi:hypothetical protein